MSASRPFDALPDGRLRVLPGVRDEPLEHALADFLERRRGRRLDLPEAERLDVPLEHVPRERQYYSEELKAELQRRHFEEGETIPELALKTGIPFGTIKALCSQGKRNAELQLF